MSDIPELSHSSNDYGAHIMPRSVSIIHPHVENEGSKVEQQMKVIDSKRPLTLGGRSCRRCVIPLKYRRALPRAVRMKLSQLADSLMCSSSVNNPLPFGTEIRWDGYDCNFRVYVNLESTTQPIIVYRSTPDSLDEDGLSVSLEESVRWCLGNPTVTTDIKRLVMNDDTYLNGSTNPAFPDDGDNAQNIGNAAIFRRLKKLRNAVLVNDANNSGLPAPENLDHDINGRAAYHSGVPGVVWDKKHEQWTASCRIDRKRVFAHFRVRKYGFERAKMLAIQWRKQKEAEWCPGRLRTNSNFTTSCGSSTGTETSRTSDFTHPCDNSANNYIAIDPTNNFCYMRPPHSLSNNYDYMNHSLMQNQDIIRNNVLDKQLCSIQGQQISMNEIDNSSLPSNNSSLEQLIIPAPAGEEIDSQNDVNNRNNGILPLFTVNCPYTLSSDARNPHFIQQQFVSSTH